MREAVQYVRRRVPQSRGEIEIRERYEEVPPVNLNRELLEWAVENLLTNAIEHGEGRPIHVAVRAGEDSVAVAVRDHGVGLSTEEQAQVFTRLQAWLQQRP